MSNKFVHEEWLAKDKFKWSYTDEPHYSRRKEILARYPQVKELYGTHRNTVWWILFLVSLQLLSAYLIRDVAWWVLLPVAYVWGGTINHSLFLVVHEVSHNLLFDTPFWNTAFLYVANLPVPAAFAVSFQKYHRLHHMYLGGKGLDPDLPTNLEGRMFATPFTKAIFLFIQVITYALRPIITQPLPPTQGEIINWLVQLTADSLIVYFWGWQSLGYLLLSTFLGGSLHPMAGHFIAEHYTFEKSFDTYSYYGLGNLLAWNVGYHVEHHDFPRIPWARLPDLKKMAPEFYVNRPFHTSWSGTMWRFIWDEKVTPFSRVLRKVEKHL
jgi:sphingolipid delta-4 desaturase